MVSDSQLRELIAAVRERGAIVRTRHDTSDCITAIQVRKTPKGTYRREGAAWLPVVTGAETLRRLLSETEAQITGETDNDTL